MTKKIKLFDPVVGIQESLTIQKILKSGFWASGAGNGNVAVFEKKFKEYINTKVCVAVNSGTAALHLALSLFDLKNKEVILPSLSFVSTAHSIIYNGGKPVFVDIEPETLCIDPSKVEEKLSNKTKVILPVHFGGMPANLTKLKKIAKGNECLLIEDAAHACGANFSNKKIGSIGDLVCFSFHPVKNLAMLTGGAITINHTKYKKMREILLARRWCGITDRKNAHYNVKGLGWNYYMNEFSASIGLQQLKKLDKNNKVRGNIAKQYSEEINLEHKMPFDKNCTYHFYWIIVKNRDQFRKKMQECGIETGIHYTPIHQFTFYRSNKKLFTTDYVGKNIVTIPSHPNLTNDDIKKIIKFTNEFSC